MVHVYFTWNLPPRPVSSGSLLRCNVSLPRFGGWLGKFLPIIDNPLHLDTFPRSVIHSVASLNRRSLPKSFKAATGDVDGRMQVARWATDLVQGGKQTYKQSLRGHVSSETFPPADEYWD
jgi:hypothetical protein